MPNPKGKNGSGTKAYPPDDVLKDTLLLYAKRGYNVTEKLTRLGSDLELFIKKTKLNELERKFSIPSVRKPPRIGEARQAVVDEVNKDPNRGNGPLYVKSKLKDKGIMIPRDTIREIMHDLDPQGIGFEQRFPGRQRAGLVRGTLSAIGPFHEISADGHEKLSAQALRMGDIGLSIYGYKDKWADNILKLSLVPDCRAAGSLGHLYLDFADELGGISLQLTTDNGPEIGWQFAFQTALREIFAPDIDTALYPPFVILKSVHNIVIESFWHWLRQKTGINLKDYILRGREDGTFQSNVNFHRDLFYWIFVPLIQAELDDFRTWWNQHRIRRQADKDLPSGHVPDDALQHPGMFGGLRCHIPIPEEAINELRVHLTEVVGPREAHLSWYTDAFAEMAQAAYQTIGEPAHTLDNAWSIFDALSNVLETLF